VAGSGFDRHGVWLGAEDYGEGQGSLDRRGRTEDLGVSDDA
jgi:hypothetical protein